jgi:multidrug resistance protein
VGKLAVLMITAFVDMVGLLMVLPLLPFYAKSLGAGGLIVGVLVSSFAMAQLIASPFWGRFSDHYGRRPALIIGLSASAVAYVVFAFADSLWLLLLSRVVQGAGGGTVSVIQAYVADAMKPSERAKGLGWLSAATNVGVAVGPVIGSLSLGMGRAAPGLFAAGLCVVNIMFAQKYLTESRDVADAARVRKPGRSMEAVVQVVTHSAAPSSRLIWIYSIAMGAFHGVNAVLALFLADRFGVTERTIGFFFMYIGVIAVVTRALILGWAVDRLGEARLSRLGLVLLSAGLVLLPFTDQVGGVTGWVSFVPLAMAVALIPLGTAFTFPCVTALLSRVVPSYERGLYMGVQQTFGGISRVIFPIAAGFAFDRVIELPFIVGAALVLSTLTLGLDMEKYSEAVNPA